MKRIQKMFSFSNVVAVLALFLALGGSVYAASSKKIDGTRIKPKSIPGNRIKAKSLTGAQIKAKTLIGAKVKPGSLTGKQVVGKTLTGVSAASLASVQYVVTTVELARYKPGGTTATANCPAGQKVIGGGAVVNKDIENTSVASGPQVSRGGWEATGSTGGGEVVMTVTAICTTVVAIGGQESSLRDGSSYPPSQIFYP